MLKRHLITVLPASSRRQESPVRSGVSSVLSGLVYKPSGSTLYVSPYINFQSMYLKQVHQIRIELCPKMKWNKENLWLGEWSFLLIYWKFPMKLIHNSVKHPIGCSLPSQADWLIFGNNEETTLQIKYPISKWDDWAIYSLGTDKIEQHDIQFGHELSNG